MRTKLLVFLFPLLLFAAHPVFYLDNSWQLVDPTKVQQPHIDYMFLCPHHSLAGLRLVMAHETTQGTLDSYLAACVQMNNQMPSTVARRLGPYTTARGLKGELLEIESEGNFGKMSTIQLITQKDSVAHILTITTDKKSFLKQQKILMAVFDSFDLCDDPLSAYLPEKAAAAFKNSIDALRSQLYHLAETRLRTGKEDASALYEKFGAAWREAPSFKEKSWPAFAHLIHNHYQHLGPIWELEALKYLGARLLTPPKKSEKKI